MSLKRRAGLGNVWSIESLRRWLEEAGDCKRPKPSNAMSKFCRRICNLRFIAKDQKAVLVTGRLPDINASEILPVVETIDRGIAAGS